MLSGRRANAEHLGVVGFENRVPSLRIHAFRGWPGVTARKRHRKVARTDLLERPRPDRAVGDVGTVRSRQREAKQVCHRRQRPLQRSEAQTPLAHVVEQCGARSGAVTGPADEHPPGHREGMALIRICLFEEERRLCTVEERSDLRLFAR